MNLTGHETPHVLNIIRPISLRHFFFVLNPLHNVLNDNDLGKILTSIPEK